MSESATVTKVSMAVEIKGVPHFVALSHDKLLLLVKLAASLTDSGILPVVKAPADFKFTTLEHTK